MPDFHLHTTTQSEWAAMYDNAPAVRESIEKTLLQNLNVPELGEDVFATWKELLDCLRDGDHNPTVESIQGVRGVVDGQEAIPLYVVPRYTWDGGCPISTRTFNLEAIASADIGGSTATMMHRRDASRPGLVMHYQREDGSLTFQIC